MPRRPRYLPAGVTQHVVQRGVDRRPCFHSDGDRTHFLGALREAALRRRCAVHAYVLMSNHVHLLLTPTTVDGLSRLMQNLGRSYVRHFNDSRGRVGALWEGRFHASAVGTDAYLLACYRYIEENPVRAGMAAGAGDYRWSSHGANASGAPGGLLTPHATYAAIAAGAVARAIAYRGLFARPLPTPEIERIRRCLRRNRAYGSERFCLECDRAAGYRSRDDGRPLAPQVKDSFEKGSDPGC